MKYLSHYTEERQTALFAETGAFFAFSEKKLNEQKKDGVKYVSLGFGMICPKSTADKLFAGLDQITKEAIQQDLAKNGKQGVIRRELGNHEYCITHDITDTERALSGYGITREEIKAEIKGYLKEYYAWEEKQEAERINKEKAI